MLYEKITQLCNEAGISIFRLERELGLGNATIRGWAASSPRLENIKRVADYFGVSVDELLKEEGAEQDGEK